MYSGILATTCEHSVQVSGSRAMLSGRVDNVLGNLGYHLRRVHGHFSVFFVGGRRAMAALCSWTCPCGDRQSSLQACTQLLPYKPGCRASVPDTRPAAPAPRQQPQPLAHPARPACSPPLQRLGQTLEQHQCQYVIAAASRMRFGINAANALLGSPCWSAGSACIAAYCSAIDLPTLRATLWLTLLVVGQHRGGLLQRHRLAAHVLQS